MFGYARGEMETNYRSTASGVYLGKDVLYVGAADQYVMFGTSTILLLLLMPIRSGKKLNDGRKNGDLWWLCPPAGRECASARMIIDVVAGAQDIMFGCGSDETELS